LIAISAGSDARGISRTLRAATSGISTVLVASTFEGRLPAVSFVKAKGAFDGHA
jgi:hypothetical protein